MVEVGRSQKVAGWEGSSRRAGGAGQVVRQCSRGGSVCWGWQAAGK